MSKATEAVSIPVQDLWRWQAVLDGIVAALGDWGCGETSAVLACLREEFRILACPEADEQPHSRRIAPQCAAGRHVAPKAALRAAQGLLGAFWGHRNEGCVKQAVSSLLRRLRQALQFILGIVGTPWLGV